MTTRAEAIKAADVIKATQPELDALKETIKQNDKAKRVLGPWMVEQELDVFRGVTLTVTSYEGWDYDKLRAYLGDKVSEYKTAATKKHFGLLKRAKKKTEDPVLTTV